MDSDTRWMFRLRELENKLVQEREARKESGKEGKQSTRARRRGGQQASGSATPVPPAQGSGPSGSKKRVVAENGKVLVVDSLGDVYLEQEDEDGNVGEYLLDVSYIQKMDPCKEGMKFANLRNSPTNSLLPPSRIPLSSSCHSGSTPPPSEKLSPRPKTPTTSMSR